ncbi:IMPACT family protein [Cutibacterium equinum]|uniref:IMPACT family protein n=1 Tax=Cutibacterium equinum TaxID=3016342 RepID=A0ABY7R1K8_9ACTN|nr:YigZ family protein [Cutibacterium equinum]WCC80810.1 IMPACT family protein [Cutibacterium equinum]
MNEYLVLTDPVEAELDIKRSIFHTRLVRVETEDAAREVIAQARRDGHDARHHVSAFVLGPDRHAQRCSDDGEPAGTAGMPTLNALTASSTANQPPLSDVVAVTSRWFGGIKLGAGGLTRAYGNAVTNALDSASLHRRILMDTFTTLLDLSQAGHEEGLIRAAGHEVLTVEYTADGAVLTLACQAGQGDHLAVELAGLLGRDVGLVPMAQRWVDLAH